MARQGKKQRRKLNARLDAWNSMKDGVDDKNKKTSYGGFYCRKPGSNKK